MGISTIRASDGGDWQRISMAERKIALTGGIATGKSTVAKMFAELGALILDADEMARRVVRPGEECLRKLEELLGKEYFGPDGTLDRRKLRERIIGDASCRARVNALLHPAIMNGMEAEWQEAVRLLPGRMVIFDIPLLFEIGMSKRFDVVVLAYAPREIQIQRLSARDGLTREEAEKTLLIQLPIETKKDASDIIIDNTGDIAETQRQVKDAWRELERRQSSSVVVS